MFAIHQNPETAEKVTLQSAIEGNDFIFDVHMERDYSTRTFRSDSSKSCYPRMKSNGTVEIPISFNTLTSHTANQGNREDSRNWILCIQIMNITFSYIKRFVKCYIER